MGVTIHWEFYCKDRKCAEEIVEKAHQRALEMKKVRPEIDVYEYDPKNLILGIQPHPESEAIHFHFEPYETKRDRFQEKGWDLEYVKLSNEVQVTRDGRLCTDEMRKQGVCYTQKYTGPKFGPDGFQTAGFTKTQYAGDQAHMDACVILDIARKLSNKHEIYDEADYCGDNDKWDPKNISEAFESNMQVIKGLFGKLKEAGWVEDQIGGAAPEYLAKKEKIEKDTIKTRISK